MKLGEMLSISAQKFSRRVALIFKGLKFTYKNLNDSTNKLANGLVENGLETGQKMAILLENCPEYFHCYYAGHKLGSPIVPINNFSKGEEIRYIVEDCSVHTLITSSTYYKNEISGIEAKLTTVKCIVVLMREGDAKPEFPENGIKHLYYHEFDKQSKEEPTPTGEFSEEDLAVTIYTSGTTGHPKGAMLSHRNLVSNAASCKYVLEMTKKDKMLLYLPMFHSFTELVCMVLPVYLGLPVVLVERIDRVEIRAAIKRYFPTIMIGVPSVYNALLGAKINFIQKWLNPIRIYISGAAPLPLEVLGKFEKKFGRPLMEGYGLSEASPVVSINPIKGVRKAGTVGLPVKDVQVKVVDDDGNTLGPNMDGELCVKGPNVMMGYYNQPEETAKTLQDGWLYTGDVARIDDDGYITIVERKKDMLIYRGCNIYPREVEELLYKHPAVKECAVVGIPDAARGEIPKAYVVIEDGQTVKEAELKKFCAENLARYKVPKMFSFEKELPMTATGKILKKILKQRAIEEHNAK
jgi:long-chain acyl-CoA synthetase